jgi:hypothetical protein
MSRRARGWECFAGQRATALALQPATEPVAEIAPENLQILVSLKARRQKPAPRDREGEKQSGLLHEQQRHNQSWLELVQSQVRQKKRHHHRWHNG